MIGQITAVATEVAGGRRGVALAGSGGTADYRGWSPGWPRCSYVGAEGLHILADEDSVLLGLIPVGLETSSEVEHWVLQDMGRTGRIVFRGWLWWWGMGGGLWWCRMSGGLSSVTLGVYRETKPGLIISKLILVRGFIARVINCFWSWYTRLVMLDHDCLNWVYLSLGIF